MALMNCPECGHEVSNEAVACPNCGRPLAAPPPVIRRRVVVADEPLDDGFPKWIIAPIVILAIVVIFLLIAVTRSNEDAANARSVNVNLAAPATRRADDPARADARRADDSPNRVEVPSGSTAVNPPPAASLPTAPEYPPAATSVPGTQTRVRETPADKGVVVIDAKIATAGGTIQPVRNEKFYLLDKDLEEILSDADLEPLAGNTLANSLGLAMLYPERYGDFRRAALAAIQKHVKYSGTTGGDGRTSLKNVEPDAYYLFGITKTRTGFAVWSSPVSIAGGENRLDLQPARLNEMNGE